MADLKIEVANMRAGAGGALAFFDLLIGYTTKDGTFTPVMKARDFTLKQKNDGGVWIQMPSKLRAKKNQGTTDQFTATLDAKGYPQYDTVLDYFGDNGLGQDGKWGLSKEAHIFRKAITEQVEAAYTAMKGETAGRGGARQTRPAAATTATGSTRQRAAVPQDEDDELPF